MSISPQFSHIFTLNTNHLPSHFYLFQFPEPFLSNFKYTGADWLYFPPGHNLIKLAHELKRCNSVTRNTQKCKMSQWSHELFLFGHPPDLSDRPARPPTSNTYSNFLTLQCFLYSIFTTTT